MTSGTLLKNSAGRHCNKCADSFLVVCMWADISLAIIKLVAGMLTGSRALTASALYSVNDFFSAVVAMISLKVSRQPSDRKHAYGYGKFEFIAVIAITILLVGGVILVMYESIVDIMQSVKAPPHLIAGGVAIIAAVGNWMLAQRGFCVARYLQSPALHTCAKHNNSDAMSSLAVFVSVMGGVMGFHSLDQYVAIYETLDILVLSGALLNKSLQGLMDRSIPQDDVEKIRAACERTKGVVRIIDMKAREAGAYAWADITVAVPSSFSVDEAHQVCLNVQNRIRHSVKIKIETQIRFRPDDCLSGFEAKLDPVEDHA
mgnify:CR=1 FL=1